MAALTVVQMFVFLRVVYVYVLCGGVSSRGGITNYCIRALLYYSGVCGDGGVHRARSA